MKKIIWIPIVLIIIGALVALAGFSAGGLKGFWVDRSGVHLENTERGKLVKVDESYDGFKDVELKADFFNQITFKEGDGYRVRGQNYERYGGLTVRLDGDKLVIDAQNKRNNKGWGVNIGVGELFDWNLEDSWLEITYPKGADFGSVTTDIDAGRLNINGFTCDKLDIDDAFGEVEITSVACGTLNVKANSGDVRFAGINVSGDATINNDFGNVSFSDFKADSLVASLNAGNADFKGISAGKIEITNDYGKIDIGDIVAEDLTLILNAGDLSADHIKTADLYVNSDFGTVRIDRLELSGQSEINQSSGDVRVGLDISEDDLSYELYTDAGSISVDGKKSGGSLVSRNAGSSVSLVVNSNFGDVTLKFLK